ncbi:FAD-binding protein [Pseudodesulfovibrio sp. JC047]|uniref:FAD-binding oxidoreductase n=1 Tax=Pseudodesulfovibrio sp. JC047 TaxID=2683199 RepID=UPI0013D552BA|nr:FAD-linked oxidase C-terminal domain-containing protein [Pseudodesulfovibrio sp. JC047]NDV18375.1 FAD-binding protein [Pseudodesulfovibrio sp. JC047]
MTYTTELTADHKQFLDELFQDGVKYDKPSLRVYESDASNIRGEVLAVVRPTCVEQVSEFMRWADAERIPVHPRGRGTSLSGGCVPTVPGIVVSMLGMDRILDISETDFVATIEPGVNTVAFQQECEKHNLFYPPDPASSKATSVGGNVVTCAGGLRAVKYGVTRDYVLGCDVVVPGGKILSFGGRTQKDVVGLDMTRFMVGSEGSLGILTKLYLKLIPKSEGTASLLVGYESLDAALQSMGKVFAAGILPCAVEFMNETVLDILKQTGGHPWPDSVNSLLLFQVDGSAETVSMNIEQLSNQIDDALWRMMGTTSDEENELWGYRRSVSSASYVLGPDRIGGDMAVPRGQILQAVRRFESLAAQNGKRLIAFGHAGDGNIHANLHYDASDPDDAKRTRKAHHEMDEAVLEFGGSLSGEHGVGCLKNVGLQLGKDEHELMLKVRGLFDPNGILNPNKGY